MASPKTQKTRKFSFYPENTKKKSANGRKEFNREGESNLRFAANKERDKRHLLAPHSVLLRLLRLRGKLYSLMSAAVPS
jgi:hypothetical protein